MSEHNSIDAPASNQENSQIICGKHNKPIGDFIENKVKNGYGCVQCFIETMLFETNKFKEKARKKHGDRYDYSRSRLLSTDDKVTIICRKHGAFEQRASTHTSGANCQVCAKYGKGWRKSDFVKLCNGAKAILYIILCHDSKEKFYKVGITSVSIETRFTQNPLPYDYKVIREIKGDAESIYDLEHEIHKKLNCFKYAPKRIFKGYTECFESIYGISSIIND